jgi:hypothetical protein
MCTGGGETTAGSEGLGGERLKRRALGFRLTLDGTTGDGRASWEAIAPPVDIS